MELEKTELFLQDADSSYQGILEVLLKDKEVK